MKRLNLFLGSLVVLFSMCLTQESQAQVSWGVNFQVGGGGCYPIAPVYPPVPYYYPAPYYGGGYGYGYCPPPVYYYRPAVYYRGCW